MTSFDQLITAEFADLRSHFFNSAYFGPSPKRAQIAGIKAIEKAANPIDFPYDSWRPIPDQVRAKIGQLLGVSGENVSHHSSVSEVISYISLGFPFLKDDVVVLMEGDYPSNVLPWMLNEKRRGYKISKLPEECFRDMDLLRKNLPLNAKVLNISHVMFNTGRRNNIKNIGDVCRERGILFVVDVSQSFGGLMLPQEELDVCEVVVGATYKWLLGPYGHAFAYWSDFALDKIDNVHLSWQSFINSTRASSLLKYTTEPLPGARRFDRGQAPNVISMQMLSQSLDLFAEIQLTQVQQHNQKLVHQFLEQFPRDDYQLITPVGEHGNIVCLRQKQDVPSEGLESQLREKNIEASVREGNLRLSFHLFSTSKEVEDLIQCLSL